jgi:hypothetical protein
MGESQAEHRQFSFSFLVYSDDGRGARAPPPALGRLAPTAGNLAEVDYFHCRGDGIGRSCQPLFIRLWLLSWVGPESTMLNDISS